MGAWGEGMQANDTALDAIGHAGLNDFDKATKKRRQQVLDAIQSGKRKVAGLFKGWVVKDSQAILGLAENLFEAGVDLTSVRKVIDGALKTELSKPELDRWRDLGERKAALLRFRDRLDGKKVDPELLANDNEGLLSRMGRVLGGGK